MTISTKDLFSAGALTEAIEAQNAVVRAKPTDYDARAFLAELLCFAGEYERADKLLDFIGTQRQDLAVGVALFRQLIRASLARRECFEQGRAPELIGEMTPTIRELLRGQLALRTGDAAEARAAFAEAETLRPRAHGTCNGHHFDDLRDADDTVAGVLEVLSSTGKYFWIPMENIASMELRKPARSRDVMWRRAFLEVRGGPDGEVYIPNIYATRPPVDGKEADAFRMGLQTDWIGPEGGPVRGIGRRLLLIGEEGRTLEEIETLKVESATAPAAG
ncbi:MAG: tetratricopeptide repeat protein [Alphaproteobacteria bacterium]|nr:tetratricopeptide repeat protein [Alphaproteobacteria bacterium]